MKKLHTNLNDAARLDLYNFLLSNMGLQPIQTHEVHTFDVVELLFLSNVHPTINGVGYFPQLTDAGNVYLFEVI
jgi:hypothetical protein